MQIKLFILMLATLLVITTISAQENYLLLYTDTFEHSSSLQDIFTLREKDYNVIKMNVQNKTNQEIKQIILQTNQQNTLSYILLFGGDNLIPSGPGNNEYYYSDINDDGLQEIALGRLPFSKESYMRNVVNKIIYYENSKYYQNKKILLMAGSEATPPTAFKTATFFEDNVIPQLKNLTVDKAYYRCGYPECMNPPQVDFSTDDNEVDKITLRKMNDILFLSYNGHGGNLWMPNTYFPTIPLFNFGNVSGYLENKDKYFIVNLQSCSTIVLNDIKAVSSEPGVGNLGYFSITLLQMKERGAVALIGSTISNGGAYDYGTKYHMNIQTETTLGKAFIKSNPGESMYLLGDPALTINNFNQSETTQNNQTNTSNQTELNQTHSINQTNCTCPVINQTCPTQPSINLTEYYLQAYNQGMMDMNKSINLTQIYNKGYNDGKAFQKKQDNKKEIQFLEKIVKLLLERIEQLR